MHEAQPYLAGRVVLSILFVHICMSLWLLTCGCAATWALFGRASACLHVYTNVVGTANFVHRFHGPNRQGGSSMRAHVEIWARYLRTSRFDDCPDFHGKRWKQSRSSCVFSLSFSLLDFALNIIFHWIPCLNACVHIHIPT